MKKQLLTICVLIFLVSCEKLVHYAPEITFHYINKSDYVVTISAQAPGVINDAVEDSIIKIGNTIRYFSDYAVSGADSGPFGTPDSTATVKLSFDSTPKRCLTFSGKIINEDRDIRAQRAYVEGENISNGDSKRINMYFIIDSTHFQQATPCE